MGYIEKVLDEVAARNAGEPVFLQAVKDVYLSLEAVIEANPTFEKASLLERMAEPERQIIFKVPWEDDKGKIRVNRGIRVQFNGAIGPYKGGTRFHSSVDLDIIKFLGFEQIFKNALTGLPIGGGKGGSDFNPVGKSEGEIRRFCQSYMMELYRHIGEDIDVPAGDIGVGMKEVGYLYGQYRRITGRYESGVITGKSATFGGCVIRPEATGYGVVYFTEEVLKHVGDELAGKKVLLSGFGNVTWGTALKLEEKGAIPITISGPDGFVYDKDGILGEKIDYLRELRNSGLDRVEPYSKKYNVEYFPGEKPWGVPADIAIPCATQNEITLADAKELVKNQVKYLIEASNMPCTLEAADYVSEKGMILAPSKAVNAGGVSASALEMSQNSMRLFYTAKQVDLRLQEIMKGIHTAAMEASKKYGYGYDLTKGANIAGFIKVADAMIAQGDY